MKNSAGQEVQKKEFRENPNPEISGFLVEVIYNPEAEDKALQSQFVFLRGEEIVYEISLTDDFGKIVLPPNNETLKKGAVVLPRAATPYENEEKLIEEIQIFIHKYLDVSPDYEIFATYYILLSWVYDRLNTIPYLRAMGDFGQGKSRFLDVIGRLCYRPIIMAGTVTPAPVYRLLGYWHGTIIYDEGDRKKNSDAGDEITKIFNCGFERGKPVLRCDKENPDDIQTFDPFGPKVIASRLPFDDQALESRCLTEIMKETTRDDIPVLLPQEFYLEQEILRQKLLYYRLKNFSKIDVKKIQTTKLHGYERRLKQAVAAFTVLFVENEALMQKFNSFVQKYQVQLIQQRENSFDGAIVHFLFERWEEKEEATRNQITSKDIVEWLRNEQKMDKVSTQTVGRHLKAMGIVVSSPQKVGGLAKRLVLWDEGHMEMLFRRYVSEYFLGGKKEENLPGIPGKQAKILVTTVTEVTTVTGEAAQNLNQR